MDKCAVCGKPHGIMYVLVYGELNCVECFDKIGDSCSHLPLSFLTDSLDSLVTI